MSEPTHTFRCRRCGCEAPTRAAIQQHLEGAHQIAVAYWQAFVDVVRLTDPMPPLPSSP
jgi:hypothetical protein